MTNPQNRRQFLRNTSASATILGLGELPFLQKLSELRAEEVMLPNDSVIFRPEIEPLVRLVEQTSRNRLLEEIGTKIKTGTSYQEILSALLLAGVRNIQPRPVGFKFHAVLVVNSAHLASMSSPDKERWLPIFWALDYFKDSQERDVSEGDWTMRRLDESKLPSAEKAKTAFKEAMDSWDIEAADAATAALTRSTGAAEIFNLFAHYGCRDYRDIGHKAIYVANSWRTLQTIGWHHAEPVLRSLAYALLAHNGTNPTTQDFSADRAGKTNLERLDQFRPGWQLGEQDEKATLDLAATFRSGSDIEASSAALKLINEKIDPSSIWDAIFNFSGELLRRHPGIVSLHAVTSSNALHFAFQTCSNEATRKLLLLQACAFMPLFRGDIVKPGHSQFDQLTAISVPQNESQALEDIFATINSSKEKAASKMFHYLQTGHSPNSLIDTARRFLFLKGSNSHDYKFTAAVLEDFYHVSPKWRNHYLAASVFNLRGSEGPNNRLIDRINAALTI
jgi:hypothetical protein